MEIKKENVWQCPDCGELATAYWEMKKERDELIKIIRQWVVADEKHKCFLGVRISPFTDEEINLELNNAEAALREAVKEG